MYVLTLCLMMEILYVVFLVLMVKILFDHTFKKVDYESDFHESYFFHLKKMEEENTKNPVIVEKNKHANEVYMNQLERFRNRMKNKTEKRRV